MMTKELYNLVVNRQDLDKLMEHFSKSGLAELVVDDQGQIMFNIPKKSSLKINSHNPSMNLSKEITKMKSKLETMEEKTAPRKRLELKIKHYEMALKVIHK
jgi:hypothetical protein